jgi:hypothetical protein
VLRLVRRDDEEVLPLGEVPAEMDVDCHHRKYLGHRLDHRPEPDPFLPHRIADEVEGRGPLGFEQAAHGGPGFQRDHRMWQRFTAPVNIEVYPIE